MKGKMLIAMAVSSMLAATLAYADPVSSDDNLSDDAQAQLMDNGNGISGAAGVSGTGSAMSGAASSSMSGTSSGLSGAASPTGGASGNDEMNADTATGDDDY